MQKCKCLPSVMHANYIRKGWLIDILGEQLASSGSFNFWSIAEIAPKIQAHHLVLV